MKIKEFEKFMEKASEDVKNMRKRLLNNENVNTRLKTQEKKTR